MTVVTKEIGGYFELEHFYGEPYHKNVIALNSGRGCLAYLIELRNIKSIWVPDFMCDSVYELFKREDVELKIYKIGQDFLPVYDDIDISEGEYFLLMDYYGRLTVNDVAKARSFSSSRLIVDESQGFYRIPWADADTTYTCRKWFGVSDGAYLATNHHDLLRRKLQVDESYSRMDFVLGRYERTASEFYTRSSENNKLFTAESAKFMSSITKNILRAIDYDKVAEIRKSNWQVLGKRLDSINGIKVKTPSVPFMYPLYLGDKAEIVKRHLIENKIYIATLWPNVCSTENKESWAYKYASGILPLPLDQRYDVEDMEYIAECILSLNF